MVKLVNHTIKINDTEINKDWYKYFENGNVTLNSKTVDIASLSFNYFGGCELLSPFCLEGDKIEILVNIDGEVTGRESIFYGFVKTIQLNNSDKPKLIIEAFDELKLLDYDDQQIEIEKDKNSNPFSIDNLLDIGKNVVDTVKTFDITSLFGFSDESKQKNTVTNFCKQLQKKYPEIIKEIIVQDVTYAYDEKKFNDSGMTDYKKLVELATLTNRVVSLKKGVLYFVRHCEEITKPFIYSPSNLIYNENDFSYYVSRLDTTTSVSGITENLKVYQSQNTAIETLISEFRGDITQGIESTKYEVLLPQLEENKARLEQEYIESIWTLNEQEASVRRNKFLNKYNKIKIEENKAFSNLYKSFENKQYGYDIVKSFNNGNPIKIYENNERLDEDNLKEFVKEKFLRNENDLVKINVDLKFGNNILRTWQMITLLILDVNGRCLNYNRRFSGRYNINSVNFTFGNTGYRTSFSCFRNYLTKLGD